MKSTIWTNTLITYLVTIAVVYALGLNSAGAATTTAETVGMYLGAAFVPTFNAYLMGKYGKGWIQKNQLLAMLIVAGISLLINAILILIGVLLLLFVDWLRSKKKNEPTEKKGA